MTAIITELQRLKPLMEELLPDNGDKTLRKVPVTVTLADIEEILSLVEMTERRLLDWRGVEEACPVCQGTGVRSYATTATWRGGVGGTTLTTDVCDDCWGTGDKYRKGWDLRAMVADMKGLRAEIARLLAPLAPPGNRP